MELIADIVACCDRVLKSCVINGEAHILGSLCVIHLCLLLFADIQRAAFPRSNQDLVAIEEVRSVIADSIRCHAFRIGRLSVSIENPVLALNAPGKKVAELRACHKEVHIADCSFRLSSRNRDAVTELLCGGRAELGAGDILLDQFVACQSLGCFERADLDSAVLGKPGAGFHKRIGIVLGGCRIFVDQAFVVPVLCALRHLLIVVGCVIAHDRICSFVNEDHVVAVADLVIPVSILKVVAVCHERSGIKDSAFRVAVHDRHDAARIGDGLKSRFHLAPGLGILNRLCHAVLIRKVFPDKERL